MPSGFAIHDLYARPLTRRLSEAGEAWRLLGFDDHLLRRFGLLELVRVMPHTALELRARPVADELWILIEGGVEFIWHDVRSASPTEGQRDRMMCTDPTLVLVPFGVAFGCRAVGGQATLIRLATHEETEAEAIERLPWQDD